MAKADNGNEVVKIEVVCEGGVKRHIVPYFPEVVDELNSITGVVDFGSGHGGLWTGYADKDDSGVWHFTHHRRIANDNAKK